MLCNISNMEFLTLDEMSKTLGFEKDIIQQLQQTALKKMRDYLLKNIAIIADIMKEYEQLKADNLTLHIKLQNYKQLHGDDAEVIFPISRLELSARAYNSLIRGGIESINELIKSKSSDLMRIRGLGETALLEISTKLARFGYDRLN